MSAERPLTAMVVAALVVWAVAFGGGYTVAVFTSSAEVSVAFETNESFVSDEPTTVAAVGDPDAAGDVDDSGNRNESDSGLNESDGGLNESDGGLNAGERGPPAPDQPGGNERAADTGEEESGAPEGEKEAEAPNGEDESDASDDENGSEAPDGEAESAPDGNAGTGVEPVVDDGDDPDSAPGGTGAASGDA